MKVTYIPSPEYWNLPSVGKPHSLTSSLSESGIEGFLVIKLSKSPSLREAWKYGHATLGEIKAGFQRFMNSCLEQPLSWLVLCNLTQARLINKQGNLTEKTSLADWPMGHFLDWWLIWEGPAHLEGNGCGLVVLDALRNKTKQITRSKSVPSVPPWLSKSQGASQCLVSHQDWANHKEQVSAQCPTKAFALGSASNFPS